MDVQKDWQIDCRNIKSRGEKLFQSKKWSDCRFSVGLEPNQEFFSCHKLILAIASPVFERMFFGSLPEKTDPILIPDVSPDIFRGIIEYIYSDKIKIDSFEKACELCYIAKKYILPHVVNQCTNFLIEDLSPKNACRTYEFAKLFEEPTLKNDCLQYISRRTKEVLEDESFMDIKLSTLMDIFNLDQLNIDSEYDLFKALNDYAIKQGYVTKKTEDRGNIQPEPVQGVVLMDFEGFILNDESYSSNPVRVSTSRAIGSLESQNSVGDLRDAIRNIRFLTLKPQQFSEIAAKFELLTESEALAIFINITNPLNIYPMPEGFSTSRLSRNCVDSDLSFSSAADTDGDSAHFEHYIY